MAELGGHSPWTGSGTGLSHCGASGASRAGGEEQLLVCSLWGELAHGTDGCTLPAPHLHLCLHPACTLPIPLPKPLPVPVPALLPSPPAQPMQGYFLLSSPEKGTGCPKSG